MASQSDQTKSVSIFYSYSHKDEGFRRKLKNHLSVLRRDRRIAEWHDRKIEAGDHWQEQIDRHLKSADIVLLLVSSDFIASDYVWSEELAEALERHERGEARVIPVILRHCLWQSTPFGKLQAVPKSARPIKSWPDQDKAFAEVAGAIERAVQMARGRAVEKGFPYPELVMIPPGSFLMGSPEGEESRESSEGPQHWVKFSKPFELGRYPVTFEEYDPFCIDTRREKASDQGWGRGRRPVINVSWDDAKAYCAWLSEQTAHACRLPSEAEWEYAARAGSDTLYWWGVAVTRQNANYGSNVGKTTELGSYPANRWGLYDMNGNVWEWVEDCWNLNYEAPGRPDDGTPWLKGNCLKRVVRGGSWSDDPKHLRSATRFGADAAVQGSIGGFRVAKTVTP